MVILYLVVLLVRLQTYIRFIFPLYPDYIVYTITMSDMDDKTITIR